MIYDCYGFVVLEAGVSPDYFWNDITTEEISALFEAKNKSMQQSWEQTRLVAYYSVQWGKNPPKINKFMPLEWDNKKANNNKVVTPELTNEQRSSRANQLAKLINL